MKKKQRKQIKEIKSSKNKFSPISFIKAQHICFQMNKAMAENKSQSMEYTNNMEIAFFCNVIEQILKQDRKRDVLLLLYIHTRYEGIRERVNNISDTNPLKAEFIEQWKKILQIFHEITGVKSLCIKYKNEFQNVHDWTLKDYSILNK